MVVGTETDVLPAGDGAKGYISATFHAPGNTFKVHEEMKKHVYDKGKGATTWDKTGEVLYNRTLVNAMITVEAVRNAIKKHGKKVTGEHVREGMEDRRPRPGTSRPAGLRQDDAADQEQLRDHEGNGPVIFQQWDGKQWKLVSDWIEPMRDVVRPMMEASAKKFADENKVTPRQCPSS